MRFIGLDVHRDFCEVAIAEGGEVRLAGRVKTTPAELELFGRSLAGDDQVVLEVTGNALAIARILEPFVGRVVLANPKSVKAATESAKTDKGDARTLAKLLAAGFVCEVWIVDEQTRVLRRRVSRRAQLVRRADAREESGARDADRQPEGTPAGQRPLRRSGSLLAR